MTGDVFWESMERLDFVNFFLSLNTNHPKATAESLCCVLALISWLSLSLHCSLLQECLLSLSAPPGWRKCCLQLAYSSVWAEPAVSSWLPGCICSPPEPSSLLASPICSLLSTFRCSNVQISQASLYVEQGILCRVIDIQLVEISVGKTKGISHTTVPLTSLCDTNFYQGF